MDSMFGEPSVSKVDADWVYTISKGARGEVRFSLTNFRRKLPRSVDS